MPTAGRGRVGTQYCSGSAATVRCSLCCVCDFLWGGGREWEWVDLWFLWLFVRKVGFGCWDVGSIRHKCVGPFVSCVSVLVHCSSAVLALRVYFFFKVGGLGLFGLFFGGQ